MGEEAPSQDAAKMLTRRTLLFLLLFLGINAPAKAQGGFTTVTATPVKDPTGAAYANCHGDAVFVPSPSATQQALLSGSVFQTDIVISQCDSFGSFSLSIPDNNFITDGHAGTDVSKWRFNISSSDGKTNFNCTILITGTAQDITSALQACAAPLPAQAGGGGAFVVKAVPCASAMAFTMGGQAPTTANTAFTVTLNCTVSTTSVVGQGGAIQKGAIAQFTLVQNNVGGFSFPWPSNFTDQPAIQGSANATTNASFWYDGTTWHAQTFPAAGGGGGGGNPAGVSGDLQKNSGGGAFAVAKINDNGSTLNVTEPLVTNSTITGPYFQSSSANPATLGVTRLASGDSHCWLNNPGNANLCLSKNASDNLVWPNGFSVGGTLLSGSGGTATFPNNTGTVAELNFAQSWNAAQSFASGTLLPTTAGGTDAGSVAFPFGGAWIGTQATNNFKITGTATAARIATLPDASFTFAGTTVPLGGTGAATFTANGVLFGNGTGALQATAASGVGTFCLTETNSGAPTFGSCAGSAATAWSSLSNPSADLSLAMGTNNSLFTHGVMTGTRHAWEILDGNSTSTGSLFNLHTGATSTMKPFTATAQGTANGVQMDTTGNLAPIGTGKNTANAFSGLTTNLLAYGNGSGGISSLTGSLVGTNPVLTLTSALTTSVPFALNTPASPTADLFDLNINSVKTSWFDNLGIVHAPSFTAAGTGALALSGTEGTCPTPAAGIDILCIGNSTTHTIQSALNGANYKDNAQFSNSGPAAHGVCLVGAIFPQLNCTSAGTLGQAFVSQGASADGIFTTLGAVGGGTGNTTNTAHGVMVGEGTSPVVMVGPSATANLPLINQVGADPIYSALPLNGSAVTNILQPVNGGTGATSLAAANIATVTGTITPNDCVKWSSSTVITDSGGTCGGAGGSARLDQLLGGTATNTINSTVFPQVWNWALTGSTTAFKFGENTAATGANNILLQASTASGSTAIPFQADNNGNGYRVGSAGLLQPVGTGSAALPGTAHGTVVSEGSSSAIAVVSPGTAGQVLISNGSGADPTYQDPIISQAFIPIWVVQDVTVTRTSAAVRNPIFSQTGTLQLTWASITGSPSGCSLQVRGVDSQGNILNNGATLGVAPANGTTSQTFTAASTLQTAAQISVVFACSTYPTAGTLTLDYTPIPNTNVTNTVAGNITQFGGNSVATGTGGSGSGIPRVTVANDSTIRIVGNAGTAVDGAVGSAAPANAVMQGLRDAAGNTRNSLSDTNGRQLTINYPDTTTASYHASKKFALSSTTDIAVMPGNATNTTVVTRILFSCTQTTAGIVNVEVVKRSAADTGGTSASITAVPDDANYAAAVSAPLSYTGTGPTVGTAIGDIDNYQLGCNAAATAGPNDIYIFKPAKPIVLRGTAQQIAINLGGAVTGGNATLTIEWFESTTP